VTPALEQHERIKMRLRLAGTSLSEVARELGVAPTTVTSVSQGYRRSRRIEAAIAAKLEESPEGLWRDRYPSAFDGEPQPSRVFNGGGLPSPAHC